MKPAIATIAALGAAAILIAAAEPRLAEERLCFQSHAPWSPRIHLNADVAVVYGIDASLPRRIETWREHGYRIHVMTGVAWGQYQDYLNGKYDGRQHWDEAQTTRDGKPILHGESKDIPYMSPGAEYGKYLTVGVKRALDAGAEAIHLEEPEFWVRGGWEPSFQREWKAYYGEDWQAPDASPDAQYRASKLKYFLYRRALADVFRFARDYGREQGLAVRCYVPTHSLLNYAHWKIVSPESSLLEVGADGYIAQVWTGTSRTPNVYEGRRRERTFETAFLEYGAMQNLVRMSGIVWYLNDPVEDNPNHTWEDYRFNWESTLVASLLQPEVWRYEIMPWPDRIFTRKYPRGENGSMIPKDYEVELQAVIGAMADMKQPAQWTRSGTAGIGVLVSDTMMFQRGDPQPSDANLGSFYGLALPLLKRGVPVEPVQMEHAESAGFLDRYRILLLTYEGQKPPRPGIHDALAKWVKAGGALVVVDDDRDPYNSVREWWNTAPEKWTSPREHLFRALGVRPDATGLTKVGNGVVWREAASPAALTYDAAGAERVRAMARGVAKETGVAWKESNALVLERGPYTVAAVLDESEGGAVTLAGPFLELFDAGLPVREAVTIQPGERKLLVRATPGVNGAPRILAASCRIREEKLEGSTLTFQAEGIARTRGLVRIASLLRPARVTVDGKETPADFSSGVLRLEFENRPQPRNVEIRLR